jgi:hypothetical protein
MKEIQGYSEEQTLVALHDVRDVLAAIELSWKDYRAQSRELTVRLVTEHRYSVAEASRLSGHHRTTISTWLDIYNAEHKKR